MSHMIDIDLFLNRDINTHLCFFQKTTRYEYDKKYNSNI